MMILSIPSHQDPLDSLVIFDNCDVPIILASQKVPDPFCLTLRELKNNQTAWRYFARNRFNEPFYNRQSIFASVQSEGGIESHLALQSRNFRCRDVGKVRHDAVKRAIDAIEQIRMAERDPIQYPKAFCVLTSQGERIIRDINCD